MVVEADGTAVSGEKIGGDKITVGDIEGSYAAIGAGASVIVNQIQQALSTVDELEKSIQLAERKLAQSIQTKLRNIANVAETTHEKRFNPYKALLDYELQDAPFFYGRSVAIQEMQERMQQSRLTILYSESGSGKSSLLQAGLASRLLAEGHFPLYLRPYRQTPTQSIKRAFLPDYDSQPELSRFADDQMSLSGFLARVTYYLGGQRLYIFIDQFEEFFTELASQEKETFAELLQACVDSDLPIWWILALRKEYFSELRLFRGLKPFDNAYFLPTFKLVEAQEVITEPAKRKQVSYEDGLVEKILTDLADGDDGIPPVQMQLICYTLFEELAEKESKEISWTLYQTPRGQGLKGAQGILTSHLSRVLNRQMSGKQRQVASRALEALTNSQKMRVKKSMADLVTELGQELCHQLDETLNILHNNHLIRRETDENDEPIYEITHDYLLAEIEIDPETQGRKLAQEIIHQEVLIYQENNESRISPDKLAMIEPFLSDIFLLKEAKYLVMLSQQAILKEEQAKEEAYKRELKLTRSRTAIVTVAVLIIFTLSFPFVAAWYFKRIAPSALVPIGNDSLSFHIEANEVSNRQYDFCVRADVCSIPNNPTLGYWDSDKADMPVEGVSAYQANEYCVWLDRALPTVEEWQTAVDAIGLTKRDGNLGSSNYSKETVPVLSEEGKETVVYHLVGNVWEWTKSFASEENELDFWNGDVDDLCLESASGVCQLRALKIVGGGADRQYISFEDIMGAEPFVGLNFVGFRCVLK